MSSLKELPNKEISSDYFASFLRSNNSLHIDPCRINLSLLCDNQRESLKTPTNGDSTLVLRYKDKESAVLSMETQTEALNLVQLQGARSRVSYQISTGFLWVNLFGDQVQKIAMCPQNGFERISMPPFEKIEGLYDSGTDSAVNRYQQLVQILDLRFSHEDLMFLRVLPKK